MTEQELDKQLKTGNLLPVYFLFGEETFLSDRAVRRVIEQAIDPAMQDFNLNIYFGAECSGAEIIETAQTLPMFSNRRLVVVRQADKLPANAQELLLKSYLADPAPETVLLFQAIKPDFRRKFFSELKKKAGFIEYKKLYENRLAPFINAEAQRLGKRIDTAAIELLTFIVGNDLHELTSQIEKAALYVGGAAVITLEDIRQIASQSKNFNAFELARFMGEQELAKALHTLQSVLESGLEPVMVLGALTSHFRKLWRIRELLDQNLSASQIGTRLKINQFFLAGEMVQAKKHSIKQLEQLHTAIYNADLGMKSGGLAADLLHGLVFQACRK